MRPESPPTRRDVVVAGHTGDLEIVRVALSSPDPTVRAAALGALVRLGEDVTVALASAAADGDTHVRRRVARLLPIAAMAPTSRTTAIERLLADPDPMVVEVACAAAGELSSERDAASMAAIVARLIGVASHHEEHLCRESAVAALGSLGAPEGRAAVLAACGDRATVRRRAVLALAAYDGPEVDEMLETMCADRDVQVRQAAEDLVAIARGTVPGET